MKKLTMTILFLLTGISIAFSEGAIRVPYPMTLRQRGMGDAFTAVSDDYYLLFTNPAGLSQKKNLKVKETGGIVQLPLLNIGLGVQSDTLKAVREVQDLITELEGVGGDGEEGASTIITFIDLLGNLDRKNIGITIEEPIIPFGFVGNRFGFNFAPTMVSFNIKPIPGLAPEVYLDVEAYTQLILGFNPFRFDIFQKDDLNIGFAIKVVGLGMFEGTADFASAFNWMEDPSKAVDYLSDNVEAGVGIGLDFGILWKFRGGINVGVSVLDAPTYFWLIDYDPFTQSPSLYNKFAFPNLRTGISYNLKLENLWKGKPPWLLENLVIAFDITNWLDPQYRIRTKTHLGATVNILSTSALGFNVSG
ncbi:MAG: hypothetical protein DRP87_07100, partial [Spirochaetes bacterium]